MTEPLIISKPSMPDTSLVREEIARLNGKMRECDHRIVQHVERMRSVNGWDYRDDDDLARLGMERDSWMQVRDRLIEQLMKIELLFVPTPLVRWPSREGS